MTIRRIEYLDSARGFAILLVVVAHTIAWSFPDYTKIVIFNPNQPHNEMTAGVIWQIIYAFHMPLFFMISGYLNYKKPQIALSKYFRNTLMHKSIALLLPYITTGFLMLLAKGYYGYWFFLSLWQLSIIAIILNCLPNKLSKWWIEVILILTIYLALRLISKHVPDNALSIEPFKFNSYLLPFFFGYLMRKYKALEEFTKGKITWYIIGFISLFSTRYLCSLHPFIYKALNITASYILPILGSLLVIEWFRLGTHKVFDRFMNMVGQNTMDIYIFHVFFVLQISAIGVFWLSTNFATCITSQIVYSLLVSALAILLSLAAANLIHKSRLLTLLLFGKKQKA